MTFFFLVTLSKKWEQTNIKLHLNISVGTFFKFEVVTRLTELMQDVKNIVFVRDRFDLSQWRFELIDTFLTIRSSRVVNRTFRALIEHFESND